MKIIIKHDHWTKPVGHFMSPMLDVGFRNQNIKETILYFNNEDEITDLYNRYKEGITWDSYGLQDEKDVEKYMISVEDFLHSEHIYILLGCVDGMGHEVLYS